MSLETALCSGSLVLQNRKDLLSFSNGPTFAALVMLRNPVLPPPPLLKNNYSVTKACRTKQNAARQLLEARLINQGERRLRTTRKQKYAAILRTLQKLS